MKPAPHWISTLFQRHSLSLRRYVGRLVSSPAVCEDLAQEAFLRVLAQRTPPRQAQSYLYQTARNLAVDHLRHQSVAGLESLTPLEEEDCGEQPGAERVLAARESLEIVNRALDELPPKCRMVFILLRLEGLSFKEVAERMALSDTMVRKYAARALTHCTARLRIAHRIRIGARRDR